MSTVVEYALLPIGQLREHEEVQAENVAQLQRALLEEGMVREPVLVARGSWVILNGHHRYAALRALGAQFVPVYLIDYESGPIRLHRWSPGPEIRKTDVIAMAGRGERYPPKTTRHVLDVEIPPHPTPIEELGVATRSRPGPRRTPSA
jgi:L-serine kinase (ADP)